MASHVHIVNKDNLSVHKTISTQAPSSPLLPGHVRVKAHLLGITMNNRSYARMGDMFAWWSTYPVPSDIAPQGEERWGIVPAWGYGQVLESKVEGIPEGSLLHGFWPTSSRPVDLKLEAHDSLAQYVETSEHRSQLFSFYNRYVLLNEQEANKPVEELAWLVTTGVVWGAGWVLAQYVFAPAPRQPIGPLGNDAPWSQEDADVSSAVVINIAGSSKTAMSVSYHFRQRGRHQSPPLAVLDVTSSPDKYSKTRSEVEHRVVSYEDLTSPSTLSWLAKLKPSRIILTDSGAPPGTAQSFHDALFAIDAEFTPSLDYVVIGASLAEMPQPNAHTKRVAFNTAAVYNLAETRDGNAVRTGHYESFANAKKQGLFDKLELELREGVPGDKGIEGIWEEIVDDTLPRHKALAFRV